MIKTKDRRSQKVRWALKNKEKRNPKQWSEWTENRRNRKIKRWKRQKVGQKQEDKKDIIKKKTWKEKSDEQREPKNKKILLSRLKQSQMPTVTWDFHVQRYKKRRKNVNDWVKIKSPKFFL